MGDALWKWMSTPEAKKIAASAQEKAWKALQQQFPRADRSKFEIQANFSKNHTASAEVFFKGSSDVSSSVFGSDRRYWSPQMKTALGVADVDGFPYQLLPLKTKTLLPILPINFTEAAPSLKKIFNGPFEIYVTPDSLFAVKLRDIFQQTRIRHNSAAESKSWLGGPNMKYWPQQLNFAVFCVTQGCGISRKVFDNVTLPKQIRAFYRFHVYFTVRRILFQMGGIQSALPGDPTFNPSGNKYDVASYKRICAEFGIAPTSDFRYTGGKNRGLGNGYIGVTGQGPLNSGTAWPDGYYKFSDEGGKATDGNLLYFVEPDGVPQYDWFAPNKSAGLTQAGLARINESIEAFVYCILGAQVNVRSSIIGEGGRAKEAQTEFLTLMESAITQPDLAKSVQRYQLAVDEAKARLNLAVAPMAWLMPANIIINTTSVVGYNNKLKQAVSGTKLGVNNTLNTDTKKSALQLMDGGPSKVNPPNSHPSNPIHKAVMAAQNPQKKPPKKVRFNLPQDDKVGEKEAKKNRQSRNKQNPGNSLKLAPLFDVLFKKESHHC